MKIFIKNVNNIINIQKKYFNNKEVHQKNNYYMKFQKILILIKLELIYNKKLIIKNIQMYKNC